MFWVRKNRAGRTVERVFSIISAWDTVSPQVRSLEVTRCSSSSYAEKLGKSITRRFAQSALACGRYSMSLSRNLVVNYAQSKAGSRICMYWFCSVGSMCLCKIISACHLAVAGNGSCSSSGFSSSRFSALAMFSKFSYVCVSRFHLVKFDPLAYRGSYTRYDSLNSVLTVVWNAVLSAMFLSERVNIQFLLKCLSLTWLVCVSIAVNRWLVQLINLWPSCKLSYVQRVTGQLVAQYPTGYDLQAMDNWSSANPWLDNW